MDAGIALKPQTRKFGKRVVAWLVLVSAILAVISGLIFRSITQLISSEGWVAHSYQVLDTLDMTQAFFLDAEAAERGYVATCKPSMLSPFRHDLPQIYAKLATLRTLTDDNDAHRDRVAFLSRIMTQELERMSIAITTTLGGHQLEAETMLTDRQNMDATQQIAATLSAMEKDERALLQHRLHDVQQFAWATLISCAIGFVTIFAILGFVFWLVRRETRRRERTETSLQQSNEMLEGSLTELQHYNEAARAIGLLGELLQTCRSTQEAMAIAARHLRDLLPQTVGAICLINNSRDGVTMLQAIGAPEQGGVLFSPLFHTDDCWSLRRGRAHLAVPDGFEPYCTHFEAHDQHVLCVPMIAQSETLGVLTMSSATPLAARDCQTIQTITEQLSLALANLKLQDSLRNQSLRDPLTGLFNRRYMDEALAREVVRAARQNAPLSIAMIDIDHFKRFNDTNGHEGGDALLAAFGRLMTEQARADDIVCRYGGEEFMIILPGADLENARARIDEIRVAVRNLRVMLHGQPLNSVTMSAGVALYPRHGATGAAVMAAADAALYEAKRNGRDRVLSAEVTQKAETV